MKHLKFSDLLVFTIEFNWIIYSFSLFHINVVLLMMLTFLHQQLNVPFILSSFRVCGWNFFLILFLWNIKFSSNFYYHYYFYYECYDYDNDDDGWLGIYSTQFAFRCLIRAKMLRDLWLWVGNEFFLRLYVLKLLSALTQKVQTQKLQC
jgi:uncharacterized membrane-anchored protein YitT (DUF2179 family)